MKKMKIPTIDDIYKAQQRINSYANHTPVLTSRTFNEILKNDLYFKCENFQKVGAFKFRGAFNAVSQLKNAELGVATHSSGNFAQALALSAKIHNIPAHIVMPDNAPQVKKDAVAGYGAEIIFCKPTLDARESTLQNVVEKTSATFIHPYDNFDVIAGNGTIGLEILEDVKDLDYVIVPIGGGGLMSGVSITIKNLSPETKIIGAEPQGADDAYRSLIENRIIPSLNPNTIADGLLTSLSDLTFEIIRHNVDEIITVSDEFIIKAMRLIWERMKIIVEPSAAITLGVLLSNKINLENKKIALVLSGGNVDLSKLPW